MNRNCKLCKFGAGRAVAGRGPAEPKLIVFADYPNKKDVEEGKPMAGKVGQLMRRALSNLVGLNPDTEVYFSHVIRCVPTDDVGDAEVARCRTWTQEDFKTVKCDLVLVAGTLAFETLLKPIIVQEQGENEGFKLDKAHGRVYRYNGKLWMPTWSPGYVENFKVKDPRDPDYPDWHPTGSIPWLFQRDLLKLKALLEKHYGGTD